MANCQIVSMSVLSLVILLSLIPYSGLFNPAVSSQIGLLRIIGIVHCDGSTNIYIPYTDPLSWSSWNGICGTGPASCSCPRILSCSHGTELYDPHLLLSRTSVSAAHRDGSCVPYLHGFDGHTI